MYVYTRNLNPLCLMGAESTGFPGTAGTDICEAPRER